MKIFERLERSDEYDRGYEAGRIQGRFEGIPCGSWVIKDFIPYCSICGKASFYRTPYCLNCGAKLDNNIEEK